LLNAVLFAGTNHGSIAPHWLQDFEWTGHWRLKAFITNVLN